MTKKFKKKEKRKEGSLEKCLAPGFEKGKYKMSLKHLTVPESKALLQG